MGALYQSSILVLAGNSALTMGVTHSYSSRPFLLALANLDVDFEVLEPCSPCLRVVVNFNIPHSDTWLLNNPGMSSTT